MRISTVDSGVPGSICAHLWLRHHHITLFEAGGRAAGHADTVSAHVDGVARDVDTGFIVHNKWRHPFRTVGVGPGVYRQALRLWRKMAPIHPHPLRRAVRTPTPKSAVRRD